MVEVDSFIFYKVIVVKDKPEVQSNSKFGESLKGT